MIKNETFSLMLDGKIGGVQASPAEQAKLALLPLALNLSP